MGADRILMHSDEELGRLLGAAVVERTTVHEWPLSRVQCVLLDDGRKLAYKSQLPPTVEAQFYARASSPILPACRVLGKIGGCDTMVLDWIAAPLLRDVARGEADLVAHGRRLVRLIGEMTTAAGPVYLDIGSAEAFRVAAGALLGRLGELVRRRRFRSITRDEVERLEKWTASPEVIEKVSGDSRLVHGDLKAGQVFVMADGYRVIDWQRPVVAPPEVDLASLLLAERIDPRRHLDSVVVAIYWFLFLYWAAEAQFDLFPEFRGPLFDRWVSTAAGQILDPNAALPPLGIPPA